MPPMGRMPNPGEKADMKAFGKLLKFCKNYLPAIVIAIVFAIGGAACTIIGPSKTKEMTNLIQEGLVLGIDMKAFVNVCVTLIVLYAVGAVLSYAQQFIMATVTQNVSKNLRTKINKKINLLPLNYFDTTTKGDILSRVTNDVDTISQTLSQSTANLVSALALFIGVIVMMFKTNAILALVTIGASVFGFILMSFVLKTGQKYFNRVQKEIGDINGCVEEVYSGLNVVKAYNGQNFEKSRFKKLNLKLFDSNWRAAFLSGLMMPIMTFVGHLSYVLIFVVGASFIVKGNEGVTIGTLIEFTLYARLFSQPLTTMASAMSSIQQASAASKRVFEIIDEEELSDESEKTAVLENVEGNVTFSHVNFGYLPEKTIINDFSAELKKGQKIAIVGPTGAGKTTMVNLLMRFYELNGGDIKIDGVSIKDMKRENLHDLFDMILQDTWLFEGTIRENLVYNKAGVTDEKLDEACAAVGLTHFIKCLPDGYDTVLNEESTLSEGQKQQLTIARAIIKDAPLLILDEATSNVDTRTEIVIQEAMDRLTKNRTAFVIAHRLSTIKNADIILVMRGGDIVEQGNHEELMDKRGFYAEIYNSQFSAA